MEGETAGGYTLIKEIGDGAYGTVFKARCNKNNKIVAIKVMDNDDDSRVIFMNELNTIRKLKHQNIIKLVDYFEDEDFLYIVINFIEGSDLFEKIFDCGCLSEDKAKKYTRSIAKALKYIWSKGIIHNDIKCENILIDKFDNINLIDFGSATERKNMAKWSINGSPAYIAPEMAQNKLYNEAVDVWSLGVCLYMMVVGKLPFSDSNRIRLYQKIMLTEPEYPEYLSDQLKDLLMSMLTKDPKKRISIRNVLKHEWLNETDSCLTKSWGDNKHSFMNGNNFSTICL